MKVDYNSSLINIENILSVTPGGFESASVAAFHYQYRHNTVYRSYCDALHIDPASVNTLVQIPYLPVSFFKTHKIITGAGATPPALLFESSGTTGETTSRHYVQDAAIYERSLLQGFEQFYGPVSQYTILALLPSYLERQNASLVYMAKTLMEHSRQPGNGFYINEWIKLANTLSTLETGGSKVLLLGVTFALLDFAAAHPIRLTNTIVMETGGMKGRRRELTRPEVHEILQEQWQLTHVHSEYGMTELLSQAYALERGQFRCTATMRTLVRDVNDPMDVNETGTGVLNVADLANIHSCCFIATEDIGSIAVDGSFRVLGRMDHSALRGCSLMAV